jgi:hypothetical protein
MMTAFAGRRSDQHGQDGKAGRAGRAASVRRPDIPAFDLVTDYVFVTDYVLEQPAKCPNCRREVLEKTLVEPA